ncbi:MAG TPA: ankyrin repeat domain-containing protein [Candidatus Saccharimonadales bacterium]|nr:ankyrin repeat domain-containing protein [Candidatus Saccharimonadales bacterium]
MKFKFESLKRRVRWSSAAQFINRILLCACISSFGSGAGAAPYLPFIDQHYFEVLRSGSANQLGKALDAGAAVNGRDAAGNTPLMLAAVYGDNNCVRLLVDRGADVNATNKAGASALMRAAHDAQKVRYLVDHGADINARSALGNSAIIMAARPWNSHAAVEYLLAHGANAAATNYSGASALMAAAAGGDEKTVRLLLKHGAIVNGQSVPDPVSFVLGGARSPLMWASFRGDVAIMDLLIKSGADVNGEGMFGTPLSQAAWADRVSAAKLLIARGANVKQANHMDGYTPLHWAASSEEKDPSLVQLLLKHGADANLGGGEHVDAFEVPQTPLMLARHRGETPVLKTLLQAGATNETPDRVRKNLPRARENVEAIDSVILHTALGLAIAPLQQTSLESKKAFLSHPSRQDCVSCHQQLLPMAAIGTAKKQHVALNQEAERELIKMVMPGELKNIEADWQAVFHPDPAHTKGYSLLAYAGENLPANDYSDSWVHHLSVIQGRDGQWFNNMPRPPIQSGDVSATALAIHALQKYPLPGRKAEFAAKVERARKWLWTQQPGNTEAATFRLMGLAWAGESPNKLQPIAKALLRQQQVDGGWAQLSTLKTDAYATGQALYALKISGCADISRSAIESGTRYLLNTQLEDGTWYVHRRAFPFQPTMKSGFPHGKDSWISATATSWAVLALSQSDQPSAIAAR